MAKRKVREENTCWWLSCVLMISPDELLLVKGLAMIESNMLMMSSLYGFKSLLMKISSDGPYQMNIMMMLPPTLGY